MNRGLEFSGQETDQHPDRRRNDVGARDKNSAIVGDLRDIAAYGGAVPDADIPVVQTSLRDDLDPRAHLAPGRALVPLRDDSGLLVGSDRLPPMVAAGAAPAACGQRVFSDRVMETTLSAFRFD